MMSTNHHAGYGSVGDEELNSFRTVENVISTQEPTKGLIMKCALGAFALLGCLAIFSGSSAATPEADYFAASLLENSNTKAPRSIALPDYLTALGPSDPEWNEMKFKLTDDRVVAGEGDGNMIPNMVKIVKFTKPHFVFRYYGGASNQCGYWWVLDPPRDSSVTYAEHFAICPEYGVKTDIVRCRIPKDYVAVVGAGQSVKCHAGNVLTPDVSNLQMSADVCTDAVKQDNHLACEYCDSVNFNLALSKCSNEGPDYIDEFVFGN